MPRSEERDAAVTGRAVTTRAETTRADPASAVTARVALAARLREIGPAILGPGATTAARTNGEGRSAQDAAAVLEPLVASVAANLTNGRVWLLLTAIAGAFPTRDDVDEARREFELTTGTATALYLLDSGLRQAAANAVPPARLRLAVHTVVVEADHTAKHDLHTGIQQVTRSLLPLWHAFHTIIPVAWTQDYRCLRELDEVEEHRTLRWADTKVPASVTTGGQESTTGGNPGPTLLVPWHSVLVLAEVPPIDANDRLSAVAAYSPNSVVAVAYDAIPIASADMVPLVESGKFGRYLAAIKFASRVAGISAAAAAEISGFVSALPTQGLTGPIVVEVALPAEGADQPDQAISRPRHGADPPATPMILVVGSHEPRKNHLAVLYAAEQLWQEGLDFSIQFIGGSGWGEEFPRRVQYLTALGRPLKVLRAVSDATLSQAFEDASFTVFPSLHEGYGLPVAESFAHRKPVITSDFGSTAEIARGGGAITVDPRDDEAITAAMRTLLTDPGTLDRLRAEIAARAARSWTDYADELWTAIVAPELAELLR